MLSGTIRYTEQDFALSQTALSQPPPLSLWKAACVVACLGAVIGYGIATLLSEVLADTVPAVSRYTVWGAVCGAILSVSFGAWWLSKKLSPMQQAALQIEQAFLLDDNGMRLSTDTAETLMKWAHFLVGRVEPDLIVLTTRDGTIVLLRPAFVADQTAWSEAIRLVSAHVSISSGEQA